MQYAVQFDNSGRWVTIDQSGKKNTARKRACELSAANESQLYRVAQVDNPLAEPYEVFKVGRIWLYAAGNLIQPAYEQPEHAVLDLLSDGSPVRLGRLIATWAKTQDRLRAVINAAQEGIQC